MDASSSFGMELALPRIIIGTACDGIYYVVSSPWFELIDGVSWICLPKHISLCKNPLFTISNLAREKSLNHRKGTVSLPGEFM
mmetsp:Transcript_5578/g.10905  ORF Transcript_5578/g.10905 Transcript_5578/m.10905 type:complete len:83 (+) Transcript_5578:288-536(+)